MKEDVGIEGKKALEVIFSTLDGSNDQAQSQGGGASPGGGGGGPAGKR